MLSWASLLQLNIQLLKIFWEMYPIYLKIMFVGESKYTQLWEYVELLVIFVCESRQE